MVVLVLPEVVVAKDARYMRKHPKRGMSGRPKREPYLDQSVNSEHKNIMKNHEKSDLGKYTISNNSFRRFLLASAKHKAVPWHFKHYRARCKATHGKCQSHLLGFFSPLQLGGKKSWQAEAGASSSPTRFPHH